MTIEDIVIEICYRLDDTGLNTYVDSGNTNYDGRAKRAFANAVFMLLDSNNYTKEDVQGLIVSTQIDASSNLISDDESGGFYYDISKLGNIKNIYLKKDGIQFKELTYNEYLNIDITFEEEIRNLIKYCITNRYIRFLVRNPSGIDDAFVSVLSTDAITNLYTESKSTVLSQYISIPMINKAIGIAVEQLIRERNSII